MELLNKLILWTFSSLFLLSCGGEEKNQLPRPIGQLRVEFPKHEYKSSEIEGCNYTFDIPLKSDLVPGLDPNFECHKNLVFNDFRAVLYISYYQLDTLNVNTLIKEARDKVYEHVVKANSIDEIMLSDTVRDVYGILYDIKGNAATPFQFFLTDSSKNFIRASLMFNTETNYDSLKPMIEYLKVDLEKLISTTEWRTN